MKKVVFILIIFVLMISLIGCGSNQEVEQTEEKDTLVVGTSPDFPPFEFIDIVEGKETIVGFDIDLINEIGKELGVEIEVEGMDFNGLVGALQSNRIDMVVAGMTPDDERREKVDFSEPYYQASQTLLVKEDLEGIITMDDVKDKIVGSQLGSTSDDVIMEFEGVEVKKYNKVTDAILDLKNGRIEAVIVEDSIAAAFVEKNPDLKIIMPEGLNTEEAPFAIALPKGEEELLKNVNAALKNIMDSGKYEELIAKWFE